MIRSLLILSVLLPTMGLARDRVWENFLIQERHDICAMNRPLVYDITSIEVCDRWKKERRPARQEQEERTETPKLFWR